MWNVRADPLEHHAVQGRRHGRGLVGAGRRERHEVGRQSGSEASEGRLAAHSRLQVDGVVGTGVHPGESAAEEGRDDVERGHGADTVGGKIDPGERDGGRVASVGGDAPQALTAADNELRARGDVGGQGFLPDRQGIADVVDEQSGVGEEGEVRADGGDAGSVVLMGAGEDGAQRKIEGVGDFRHRPLIHAGSVDALAPRAADRLAPTVVAAHDEATVRSRRTVGGDIVGSIGRDVDVGVVRGFDLGIVRGLDFGIIGGVDVGVVRGFRQGVVRSLGHDINGCIGIGTGVEVGVAPLGGLHGRVGECLGDNVGCRIIRVGRRDVRGCIAALGGHLRGHVGGGVVRGLLLLIHQGFVDGHEAARGAERSRGQGHDRSGSDRAAHQNVPPNCKPPGVGASDTLGLSASSALGLRSGQRTRATPTPPSTTAPAQATLVQVLDETALS